MTTPQKTPGVYIVEKDAFPNSVVQVATAVPAFIGYTQKAMNRNVSLKNTPFRITSLAEFHQYFGRWAKPTLKLEKRASSDTSGSSPFADASKKAPLPVDTFTVGDATYSLQQIGEPFLLYQAMRHFFANGGGPCYIVSVGNYQDTIDANALISALTPLVKEPEPTLIVVPDAVRLTRQEHAQVNTAVLSHCGDKMKNRFAILDILGGHLDENDSLGNPIAAFRSDIGSNNLHYGAAYYPWLNTSIFQSRDFTFECIQYEINNLLADVLKASMGSRLKETISYGIDDVNADFGSNADETLKVDKALRASVPLYKDFMDAMAKQMNLLPPSAAMAGIYTAVDNSRGVWKAPANVGVIAVTSPAINIDNTQQEDLNVSPTGKSINAIRPFAGEGTLVWGARTLDGNSVDWRYISVRRTMIMLEESIRLATRAYVFEPNNAQTWVTVRSMIENFLTSIWKQGGLAGAATSDAFSVHVGLGDTMTPIDILEGRMIVTVLVAVTRPAEFIQITFKLEMQES